MRAGIALALALGLLSGLSACGQPAEMDIRVGMIAPTSGEFANLGSAAINAAQLVVQEINAAGGLDLQGRKHKIVLVIKDDQGNAEQAVSMANELIRKEKVVALIGPMLDNTAIAVATWAENAQIPMISPTSTARETTEGKRYVFRATYTNDFQGEVMARFAIKDLGLANTRGGAAVIYDIANAYSRSIAETFKRTFEDAGVNVRFFESYVTGTQDFNPIFSKVVSNIDIIVLPNYPEDVALQVQQARALGIFQTTIGGDALSEIDPAEYPELDRIFLTAPWHPEIDNERSKSFVEAYRQAYDLEPTSAAALTYDALGLLVQAIQKQGQADSEAIRTGLASTGRYEGITGVSEYQGSGDPLKSVVILQIKNGKFFFYKSVNP
jgi:branched-chain amino acid transport system substrate-binding protein